MTASTVRRHHAFSDREGHPHSPWLFGTGPVALAREFWHAHLGWLFERVSTNAERFAPDRLADRDLRIVDRLFPLWEEKPMTAALPVLSPDRPPPVATLAPDPHPSAELLTVTAHPVPPDTVVIRVRGEVDLFTSPLLRDVLLAQLHGPARRLIVDLTAVGFFGAAGLTVLATIRHAARAAGVGLGLVANTRPVLLPLTITGMHTQFGIYPDLIQALVVRGWRPGPMTP